MAPRSTLVRLDGKNDEWIPEKALARARLRAAELGGVYDWWHSLDAPDNRTPKERERERKSKHVAQCVGACSYHISGGTQNAASCEQNCLMAVICFCP
jgi:hypothetical protein